MKEELERTWREEPLAWPMNIAGWSVDRPIINLNRCNMVRVVSWKNWKKVGNLFARKCRRNRLK